MARLFYLGTVCLLCLLVACGGKTNSENESTGTVTPPAANQAGIKLITYRYLVQDQEIVEAFEQKFGAQIDVERLPISEIIQKAQNNQLIGDVVMVPTLEDATRLKNFGRLQPFYVDAFAKGNVDDGYQDDEGYYAGLSRWTMAAIYNPNAVAIDEVRTYKGLAKLPARGIRLGLAHPDSSGLAATVAGIARIVNDKGAALWAKLLLEGAQGGAYGSDYDQLDRMLKGDLDIAFVSSGAAIRWFLNGDPDHFAAAEAWRVKYPRTETDQVNFFNMTSIGVLANSPNRELALRFINYLFQKEQQEKMGDAIFEYPNEAFSLTNDYLLGVFDTPGREINTNELESRLPLAWGIINRLATEN
ncbi:MAG: extracellular solute-binding protein [Bacteroidota bacterium]